MPPSVLPARLISSMYVIMRCSASASSVRSGDASAAALRSSRHRRRPRGVDAAEVHEMAADAHVELVEKTLTDGRGGDARRRLARRRALENVARVVAIVLENAGEIGVAGPNARDGALAKPGPSAAPRRSLGVVVARRGIHDLLPVLPVAIVDEHRDRRPERLAGAHAGQKLDRVLLDLHAAPAAVALLAARELGVDVVRKQRNARRHSFENADEGWPCDSPAVVKRRGMRGSGKRERRRGVKPRHHAARLRRPSALHARIRANHGRSGLDVAGRQVDDDQPLRAHRDTAS